jgi:hypothetical protein
MIHVRGAARKISGWAEAGEVLKVVNHVRLVVVTAGERGIGPVDDLRTMQERHGALKAANAAERFGRETHLLAEQSDEAAYRSRQLHQ